MSILASARKLNYGTPFFFTRKDLLEQSYLSFKRLFGNDAEICYALKANSEPAILTHLKSLGSSFEAASAHEIKHLLDLGVNPNNIIYGTSIKPSDHIKQAFASGVDRFAADSKEEVDKVAACAPGARVYVRSIVDDTDSVFKMSYRFGAHPKDVKDILIHALKKGLKLYGISFYVGSQAAHANKWGNGIKTVQPIIEDLATDGITLEILNLGGGIPVRYDNHPLAPQLDDISKDVHRALSALPYKMKLLLEPGRGLVASSTVLVSSIVAKSDRHHRSWLCLDAGIYNALFEAMVHQGATRYTAHPFTPPQKDEPTTLYTITGPTGDSLDIIADETRLPSSLKVGDKLIFENAGAYTLAMASRFNGFPPVPAYFH